MKTFTTLSTILVAAGLPMSAQSAVTEFVPFNNFMERTASASAMHVHGPQSRVKGAAEFDEMKRHLTTMYEGIQVSHSFVKDASHFDCIPVGQQPSVRVLGLDAIATPPPAVTSMPGSANLAKQAAQVDRAKSTADEFGNAIGCQAFEIPVRRITLDEMTKFPNLRAFFDKKSAASEAAATPAAPAPSHKYAYVQQAVNNLGGNSNISLWNPYVNTGLGEVFTLSQEWYVGGSGAALQTAEVGWQNFPAKYGSQNASLFIYFTADAYSTTGCYNLECAAFVQVAESGILGAGFDSVSTVGGDQQEFSARFSLYAGNWWLAINDTWIGYYPGSIYKGGQMTKFAQEIKFGTESVGTTVWPAEGSGEWSTSGWGNAAYQRNLFYADMNGMLLWDTLQPVNPSPACYSASGPLSDSTAGWELYFFVGGPGGAGC